MHGPTWIFWANLTPFSLKLVQLSSAAGSITNAVRDGVASPDMARIALDVKVILTPPCIFHSRFSIQIYRGASE